jgi:tetratricopeptide (TPR) repeat protein
MTNVRDPDGASEQGERSDEASSAEQMDRMEQNDQIEQIDALERAGVLSEARTLAIAGAEAAEAGGAAARAAGLWARASELAHYTQGAEAAAAHAERACQRAEAAGDAGARADAWLATARVRLRLHTETALDEAEEALERAGAVGGSADGDADAADDADGAADRARHATALKLRGLIAARRGRARDALECFDRAYRRADGQPALRARVLLSWAVQLRNWGLFDDAERKARRSLEIRLQLGDHYGAALCYGALALIHQRQGDWASERDALVADLRVCERIGSDADVPGLHARLAGALLGLGKYAGAAAQARRAIAAENQRLGVADVRDPADTEQIDDDADAGIDRGEPPWLERATRVHAFAWRELARVCLAQGRVADGLVLAERAAGVFKRLRDGYGRALCRLTEAELAAAAASEARTAKGDSTPHIQRASAALRAAQPVFVRLGALLEAAQAILTEVELRDLAGDPEGGADLIVYQVLPMLQQAGLGDAPLFARARGLVEQIAPHRAFERAVTQAATLRTLAAIVTEDEPQPGTAVAARIDAEDRARAFARDAIDHGAVVLWPDSKSALAVLLGPDHASRAAALIERARDLALATATGLIDLEHMWPAGVRARGAPVDEALALLAESE